MTAGGMRVCKHHLVATVCDGSHRPCTVTFAESPLPVCFRPCWASCEPGWLGAGGGNLMIANDIRITHEQPRRHTAEDQTLTQQSYKPLTRGHRVLLVEIELHRLEQAGDEHGPAIASPQSQLPMADPMRSDLHKPVPCPSWERAGRGPEPRPCERRGEPSTLATFHSITDGRNRNPSRPSGRPSPCRSSRS